MTKLIVAFRNLTNAPKKYIATEHRVTRRPIHYVINPLQKKTLQILKWVKFLDSKQT
jgi:hypothetical protein